MWRGRGGSLFALTVGRLNSNRKLFLEFLFVIIVVIFGGSPDVLPEKRTETAAGSVFASTASATMEDLYHTALHIQTLLQKDADPIVVKEQIDGLIDRFLSQDLSKSLPSLEGLHALSSELHGLKLQFASLRPPDKQLAEERIQRLSYAFEALSDKAPGSWRSVAKEMINESVRLEQAIERQELQTSRRYLQSMIRKQREIGIVLLLKADPSQVNLLQSASSFMEQQLSQDSAMFESIREPVRQYRLTLQKIADEADDEERLEMQKEIPNMDLRSWWIAAFLVASSGFLIYRRMRKF
jgi:hypothetical protein